MIRTSLTGVAATCVLLLSTIAAAHTARAADPAGAKSIPVTIAPELAGHGFASVMGERSTLVGTAHHHLQWHEGAQAMLNDYSALLTCLGYQTCPDRAIALWSGLVKAVTRRNGHDRIAFVNQRINALIAYRIDLQNFGRRDYWASPGQALGGQGDCEDYAFAIYWTLRALGVPAADLRLVVLKSRVWDRRHAVLLVRDGGGEILLDNRSDALQRAGDLADFRPVYSLNEHWKWVHPPSPRRTPPLMARDLAARHGVL